MLVNISMFVKVADTTKATRRRLLHFFAAMVLQNVHLYKWEHPVVRREGYTANSVFIKLWMGPITQQQQLRIIRSRASLFLK